MVEEAIRTGDVSSFVSETVRLFSGHDNPTTKAINFLKTSLTVLESQNKSKPKQHAQSSDEDAIVAEVSALTPRGRFTANINKSGISLQGKAEDAWCESGWGNFAFCFQVPKAEGASGKAVPPWVVLVLQEPANFRKQSIKYFVMCSVDAKFDLSAAVATHCPHPLASVQDFSSTAGKQFVKCHHGVNDGALYPLQRGILFLKPPLFLPADKITSVSGDRNGGRFVDFRVDSADTGSVAFCNIERDDAALLHAAIARHLKSNAKSRKSGDSGAGAGEEQDDDDSEDADSDYKDTSEGEEGEGDGLNTSHSITIPSDSDHENVHGDDDEDMGDYNHGSEDEVRLELASGDDEVVEVKQVVGHKRKRARN